MADLSFDKSKYPILHKYTKIISPPARATLNRGESIKSVLANLDRPEISNVILLGPAGSGKTAIVNEVARLDTERNYLEVDLALMSSSEGTNTDGSVEMASRMKRLVNEVENYQSDTSHQELVLFMDEFHQIALISSAALQAIKPLLAESGRRRVKIIAATTFEEFNQYIRPDEALTERLQRITVRPVDRETVVSILRSMKKLNAPHEMISKRLYYQIVDLTNRYIPSQVQPRKSIRIFDAMLGWNRFDHSKLNRELLNRVLYQSYGIRADWQVDIEGLSTYLNKRVVDQKPAVHALCQRLYMSVANLVDQHRPQGSFLFTGSTGVGKTEMAKALTYKLFGSEDSMIRFDMSEYAEANTVSQFRKQLATEVWAKPFSVILLDEIEKAHPDVTRLLLQVLDDARLSDSHGRTVSFGNAYIILTTNQAQDVYKQAASYLEKNDDQKDELDDGLKEYRKLIRRSLNGSDNFPTELLNRLDDFIPFAPLKRETRQQIATLRLRELYDRVARQDHTRLHIDKQVMDYLILEHVDDSTDAGGGRGIKRKIDQDITSQVAKFMVLNPDIDQISVKVGGHFAHTDKYDRIGSARIIVAPYQPPKSVSTLTPSYNPDGTLVQSKGV